MCKEENCHLELSSGFVEGFAEHLIKIIAIKCQIICIPLKNLLIFSTQSNSNMFQHRRHHYKAFKLQL